jgi:serine/threonine protein kinase
MTTGSRPFRGETSAELMSSILRDTPPPATEVRDELPDHLGRILRRCLEKDLDRRYQTALDLRNELEDLKNEIAPGG